jgi:flagellar biogenesis protein FliO
VRSRIEVPISTNGAAARQPSTDTTVLFVELDGHMLSVKTRLDHPEVKLLADQAKATQLGSDLHLSFPRHALLQPSTAPVVPATIKPPVTVETKPAIETKPAAPAPAPVMPEIKHAAPTPEPAPAPVAKPIAAAPAAVPAAAPVKPAGRPIPPEQDSALTSPGLYAIGALVTLLACGYILKKKKKEAAATASIDIVAQRSIGNKAKIMWLSAGGRELLVSVTQQNVRMLGQWDKSDRELPRATSLEHPSRATFQQQLAAETAAERPSQAQLRPAPQLAPSEPAEPAAPPVASSAVSGILKLRARTSGPIVGRAPTIPPLPQINADVATDDEEADLEWAREILTASGARR